MQKKEKGRRFAAITLAGCMAFQCMGTVPYSKNNLTNISKTFAQSAETTTTAADATTAADTSTTGEPATTTAQSATTTAQPATTTGTTPTTEAPAKPVSVAKLNVGNQTMNSITVSWDAVDDMDGYILESLNEATNTWSQIADIKSEKDKKSYEYVVKDLNAGTAHRFRIFSYKGGTDKRSEATTSIRTGCQPGVANVTIKGGSATAKLSWTQSNGASGYHIYMKSGSGAYELIETIKDPSATSYRKYSLVNGVTYTFKVCAYTTYAANDNGYAYSNDIEGPVGNEAVTTPAPVSPTSTAAYRYSTKTKFKASSAYKTYALAKKINYKKSFITPGVVNTNVNGITSANYVPQGNVCAKGYYFLAAYDTTGAENSVIYIMKRSNHKYMMTIELPTKDKVTDMAYDGTNIWLTAGNQIACIRYQTFASLITTGLESASITSYLNTYSTISAPQSIAYYKNTLWVGTFSTSTSYMQGYAIGDITATPTLTYKYRMQLPSKTKAAVIDSDGKLYITRSYQIKKGLSGYISQVRSYNPSWSSPSASGTIKKNTALKYCKLPAMASGITIYNTYTYINFESAKQVGCKYPTDRTWAIKTKTYLN